MSEKRTFFLVHTSARNTAIDAVRGAPDGYMVTLAPKTRNSEQSAKFHAICGDIAKSKFPWAGKARTGAEWKLLLVSGHSIATKEGADMVPGLENEFLNLRESTALMSTKRAASLIEYSIAFCVMNNIRLSA